MATADSLDHDFDGFWKEALDQFLVDFLELLAPDLLALLDVSQPIESLEKELHELFPEACTGRRFVDKLFKIALKRGGAAALLFHVDAQGDPELLFAERMFIYRYRIFDKHRLPLYSLAILADDDPNWRPDRFERRFHDDLILFKFRTIKLLDFVPQIDLLEASRNPFALLIAAYLRTRQTRPDRHRLQFKVEYVRRIFESIRDRTRARRLLRLVNWVMRLPDDLKLEFRRTVNEMTENSAIPEMMDFEIEWMEKGRVEGEIEAKRSALLRIVRTRFGPIEAALVDRIRTLSDLDRLDSLIERAVLAPSPVEFELGLPPIA